MNPQFFGSAMSSNIFKILCNLFVPKCNLFENISYSCGNTRQRNILLNLTIGSVKVVLVVPFSIPCQIPCQQNLAGVLSQIAEAGAQTGSHQELKIVNFENPSSEVFQNGVNMRTWWNSAWANLSLRHLNLLSSANSFPCMVT